MSHLNNKDNRQEWLGQLNYWLSIAKEKAELPAPLFIHMSDITILNTFERGDEGWSRDLLGVLIWGAKVAQKGVDPYTYATVMEIRFGIKPSNNKLRNDDETRNIYYHIMQCGDETNTYFYIDALKEIKYMMMDDLSDLTELFWEDFEDYIVIKLIKEMQEDYAGLRQMAQDKFDERDPDEWVADEDISKFIRDRSLDVNTATEILNGHLKRQS